MNGNERINNKVAKNAAWLIAGRVFQSLINLLVGLLTARYLGPGNYGLISYAAAYTTFFTAICTLGINSVIVKELIDDPENEGRTLGTALGLRAVTSILSALAIIGISCILDAKEPETQLVVALYSISLCINIFEVFAYWFQSRLQSKKAAIASLAAYSLTAIYKLVLLFLHMPTAYFAVATSIDYLCVAVILIAFYRIEKGKKLSFSWDYGKQLLGRSRYYISAGLMVAIYTQTDKIMLKQLIGETAIGYYSTALSLCNAWCFLLTAVITSMEPVILRSFQEDKAKFLRLNCALYSIVFYLSCFVSVGFMLFGNWLVPLLYGETYLPAAAPLRILTWQTAFSYLGVARNTWIVCENRQKYLSGLYFSAALVNVLLNFLLIPPFGASGAAFASLAAQAAIILVIPFFMEPLRENAALIVDAILLKWLRSKG